MSKYVFIVMAGLLLAAAIALALPLTFVRGDINGDGSLDVSDPVYLSDYLFLGGLAPPCMKAADANDDGEVNIADGSYLINYLYLGGPAPPPPFPVCGPESTSDGLTCIVGCE